MITIPIRADAGRYDVLVGGGLLSEVGGLLRNAGLDGAVRLVADETVYRIYGQRAEDSLRAHGYAVSSFAVESGEASKSLETAAELYDWMIECGTERRDIVLAMGGGVVGDLAGFVASTYMRGVRLVQLPTSLLAQVDSSVGGKVAVNHPKGKNLIGAFHPPSLVVADPDTLLSLPRGELAAALGEVVKMAVILDADFFEDLELLRDDLLSAEPRDMETVIGRTVRLKAEVVEADEREGGLRAILNYGHTIAHGVEAASGYIGYRHGEAVAIGMVGAARIAVALGMLDPTAAERQEALLRGLGLPVRCPDVDPERVWQAMMLDKKSAGRKLRWVLPTRIGEAVVGCDVPAALAREVVGGLAAE